MRDWLKNLDEIDLDCVLQYERLLGRPLAGYAEYQEIDSQVDEMVLEWTSRKKFFEAYPELAKYRHAPVREDSLDMRLADATARSGALRTNDTVKTDIEKE